MRNSLTFAIAAALLAGCSGVDHAPVSSKTAGAQSTNSALGAAASASQLRVASRIAALPDRGTLLAYGDEAPVERGSAIWRSVQLSEAHALDAIQTGSLALTAPNGSPIRLKYQRHVEHPDGSWSWIGRPEGAGPGTEAIITFGEKAVFGSIPYQGEEPLQLTMAAGRTWMVETDPVKAASAAVASTDRPVGTDFLIAPENLRRAAAPSKAGSGAPGKAAAPVAQAAASASLSAYTVDIVLGYTDGFATRLGGRSQALTRLNFIVDVTNQAYINSRVNAQLRLVHAVQVGYPDATTNRSTLFELSGVTCVGNQTGSQLPDGGVTCSPATVPTTLQPLLDAREQYGADLVALVRKFEYPENQSCGLGWMLGGGQSDITSADANMGLSVVSDSSGTLYSDSGNSCREDSLAHELGHNMGLQHDREVAAGTDDTDGDGNLLDPQEYGRYPYAFGYTEGTEGGNFYDIMAIKRSGRTGYRVFSSPRINSCGGFACGVVDVADAARALAQTIPVIAKFRASVVRVSHDFNGDGRSDILWRNGSTGSNVIWESANSETPRGVSTAASDWSIAATADFSGDGRSDVLWRNRTSGQNVIWKSANSTTPLAVSSVTNLAWKLAGSGDFNGDGIADLLWHNDSTGASVIWKSANSATPQAVKAISNVSWKVAGVGDFNGDGQADILWRNSSDGSNVVWKSANANTPLAVRAVTDTTWKVAGVADFNGDGRDDILWHNDTTGGNAIWLSASSTTQQAITGIKNTAWKAAGTGDFDGDGVADILWRNGSTGENLIWLSANGSTPRAVATVANLAWSVAL